MIVLAGCSEREVETVYDVRGRYAGAAFNGQAIVVDHERIPGYMEAMRMTLKLDDPADLEGVEPGDNISFELVVTEEETYVRDLAVLPADTELQLDTFTAPAPADSL